MLHSLFFTSAKGFYLGADGTLKAKDGYFEGEINATSGNLENITVKNTCVFEGKVSLKRLSFSDVCPGDIKLGQICCYEISLVAGSKTFTAIFRGQYLLKLTCTGFVSFAGNLYVKINSETYKAYLIETTGQITFSANLTLILEIGDILQLSFDSLMTGRVASLEFNGDIYTDLTEDLYMYQQSLAGFSE